MISFSKAVVVTFLALAGLVSAEEKNGLLVTVSRKIVMLPLGADAAEAEWRQFQTLTLTAKSTSFRNFTEGTVQWTVLHRNSSHGVATKYMGTEKLPPLRRIESAEIPLGVISVGTEQTVEKEKIDYEVIVSHDGKETLRVTNTSGFAALAEAAKLPEKERALLAARKEARRLKGDDKPGGDAAKPTGTEKESPPPNSPATPGAPVADTKTSPAPAVPSEPRKTAAELPPEPKPSFDFFNLGGKKPPTAK